MERFFRHKVPWTIAVDLAQRTFERVRSSQRTARSFRTYLLGLAKHELFDHLRAEQRKMRGDAEIELIVAARPHVE